MFKTADQLMAGASILSRPAEEFGNDVCRNMNNISILSQERDKNVYLRNSHYTYFFYFVDTLL